MTTGKRGKAITLHTYDLRLSIASENELSDKRLAALASRLQMLLTNLGYSLWPSDDGTQPISIESHSVEEINGE